MTNKKTLQRLKLDPYFSKTIQTNLNVWSHDQNSYEIKFEFYDHQCEKPIDLTGADMRILLDHEGSQPKIYPLEVESKVLGLAKFIMPEQIRGCEGKFTAHIYADYPNHTNDFGSFSFYTKVSRIDGDLGGCMDEIYVAEFEKALQDIKDKSSQFDEIENNLNQKIETFQGEVDDKLKQIEEDVSSSEIAKKDDIKEVNARLIEQTRQTNRLNKGVDFIDAPVYGYKEKDLWKFEDGTSFDGMNLLDDSESIYKSKGTNEIRRFFNINELKEHTISFDYELEESEDPAKIFNITIGSNVKRVTINDSKKGHITYNFTPSAIGRTMLDIIFGTGQAQSRENAGYLKNVIISSGEKEYPYSPSPTEVIKGNKLLISKKDNNDLNFNDWTAYDGVLHKPNIIDMQGEINELKNAITTLGGTL